MRYSANSLAETRRSGCDDMTNIRKLIFWPIFAVIAAGCLGASYYQRYIADQQFAAEVSSARDEALRIQREVVLFTKRVIPSGRPFALFLNGIGIDSPTTARLVASAQPVFDLRRLRAGNELDIGRSVLGALREARYNIDTHAALSIAPAGDAFHSTIETIPSHTDEIGR